MRKPRGYWTLSKCKKEAKKYSTRIDFAKYSDSAYRATLRYGWTNECFAHMTVLCRQEGYSLEELITESKKHSTKKAFATSKPAMVLFAYRKGLMPKICGHMKPLGNLKKRQLYVFEHPDKTVYVGQSCDPLRRYKQHLCVKRRDRIGKIIRIKQKKFKEKQVFKIISGFYTEQEIGKYETELAHKYEKGGWVLLNTKSALGALGGCIVKWTFTKCVNVAKQHKSRLELHKKYKGIERVIRSNKWESHCYAHMDLLRRPKYSDQELLKMISNVRSISELRNGYANAYQVMCRRSDYAKWTSHLERRRKKKRL